MEDKVPTIKEMCVVPELRHNMELKIAAFGAQTFQCTNGCGLILDVLEDSQP